MLVSHFQSWLVGIPSALFHILFYLWNLVETEKETEKKQKTISFAT